MIRTVRLPFLDRSRRRFPTADDFGFVELRGGESRVVIVPALGGKICELHLAGRQWLWRSDVIPYTRGVDGTSYVETADSGGFDECFPTIGACRVPGWVRTFGGSEIPDHGELWSQEPSLEFRGTPEGQRVTLTWRGVRMPYRFERAIRVTPDGTVHMEYAAINEGPDRLPFIWSAHPIFPLTPETRLVLPEGARMRIFARHEIELGELRSEHRWPFVRGGGKVHDFVAPYDVARRYACKFFLDMPEGMAVLRDGDAELRVRFDTAEVPHFGVWLNKRGWTPFRREEPYQNLAFEPCIGAPDTLSEALGDWKSAAWIEPRSERRWTVSWSGRRVTPAFREVVKGTNGGTGR
jgi:galactose mutarotase-like enzyme